MNYLFACYELGNLDQCMLVVTVNYPETSTTFIDRFLALAEVNQETGTILKDYTTIGEHTFRNVEKIMLSRQTLFVIDRTERTITGIPINELN